MRRITLGAAVAFDLTAAPDPDSVTARALWGASTAALPVDVPALPALTAVIPSQQIGTLAVALAADLPLPVSIGGKNAVIRRITGTQVVFDRPVYTAGAMISRRCLITYDAASPIDERATIEISYTVGGVSVVRRDAMYVAALPIALPFGGDALMGAWPGFALMSATHGAIDPDDLINRTFAEIIEGELINRGINPATLIDLSPLKDVTVNRALYSLALIGCVPPEYRDDIEGWIALLERTYGKAWGTIKVLINTGSPTVAPDTAFDVGWIAGRRTK